MVPCPGRHFTLNYYTHLVIHRETNLLHCWMSTSGPHIPGGMGGPRGNGFRVVTQGGSMVQGNMGIKGGEG